MKFLNALGICLVLAFGLTASGTIYGVMLLGEESKVLLLLALGLLGILLLVQGWLRPPASALIGACIGIGCGSAFGAFSAMYLMHDSFRFIANYRVNFGELPVQACVTSLISLAIAWAAFGVSKLLRRPNGNAA